MAIQSLTLKLNPFIPKIHFNPYKNQQKQNFISRMVLFSAYLISSISTKDYGVLVDIQNYHWVARMGDCVCLLVYLRCKSFVERHMTRLQQKQALGSN